MLKGFCEGTKRALSHSAALSRRARFLSQLWVFSCRAASRKSTTALKHCSSAAALAVANEAGCAALLSLCPLGFRLAEELEEATNSRTCSKLCLKAATCCTNVGTAVGSMPIGVSNWLRCSTFCEAALGCAARAGTASSDGVAVCSSSSLSESSSEASSSGRAASKGSRTVPGPERVAL